MPSRDEQLKANCLRGWKMPWCTDCEGFIWYFITPEISTALLSPNKIAQQQREWTIIQNIHYYYSLQKCSSGNPIKRHKYIKCKNSVYIFTLYTINLRWYPWHPLPFPTVFSIYFFFLFLYFLYRLPVVQKVFFEAKFSFQILNHSILWPLNLFIWGYSSSSACFLGKPPAKQYRQIHELSRNHR